MSFEVLHLHRDKVDIRKVVLVTRGHGILDNSPYTQFQEFVHHALPSGGTRQTDSAGHALQVTERQAEALANGPSWSGQRCGVHI